MKKGRSYRRRAGLFLWVLTILILSVLALFIYVVFEIWAGLNSENHETTSTSSFTSTKTFADMTVMNPFVAQEQFKNGELPDPGSKSSEACSINGLPDGQLLARVELKGIPTGYGNKEPVKIFCGILTHERDHKTNTIAVKETWGKQCNGFIAFSTKDDETVPAVKIYHPGDVEVPVAEGGEVREGDNTWQQVRSVWQYIHTHYADKFDFFLLGRDDTFVIVDNLRYFLMSGGIQRRYMDRAGLYLGRRFRATGYEGSSPGEFDGYYNSKMPGYVLDKHALKKFAQNVDAIECLPDEQVYWDDINMAECLYETSQIIAIDTTDEHERQRFHPFTPGMHLQYKIPDGQDFGGDWYPKEDPNIKEGFECCSTESISFHYCHWDVMRQLHSYLYHCADKRKAKE